MTEFRNKTRLHWINSNISLTGHLMVGSLDGGVDSVEFSCQKHPGPSVQELKKVVCPSRKLSAQIFLPLLQLLELFSWKCTSMIELVTYCNYCIPDAKRGYYGFIIVVVRVRRDFLLATYSPHFFPDFFHIWQVAWYGRGLATLSFW